MGLKIAGVVAAFDTFGCHLLPHGVGKFRDRIDDMAVCFAFEKVDDEGFIDFDRIDREFGKVFKTGVAGAEVIQGDAYTGFSQF